MSRVRCVVLRLFLSLGVVGLASGCATPSVAQVGAFGSASKSLAESTRKAFALVDSSTIDRKMYDVASDPTLGPTDAVFQGVFTANTPGGAEKLAQRLAVLDLLGTYAGALEALATADFRLEVDAASKDLYGSLVGLREQYRSATGKEIGIGETELGLIATAVSGIGTAIADEQRRQALRRIITTVDPAIQNAALLIEGELGDGSPLAQFVVQNLTNVEGSMRTAYNLEREKMSFDARYAMLERIRKLHELTAATPAFFRNVSSGVEALGNAHAALKKAAEQDDFTHAELAAQIGLLADRAKAAQAFRASLAGGQ